MKILIFGSSSFAARGLAERLESDGHEVWTYDRNIPTGARHERALAGSYDTASKSVAAIGQCGAVINFAIVKFGSIEENRRLLDHVIAAATAVSAKRLIHISSISVLPSNRPTVDETTPAVNHRWKGSYSRIKADAEHILSQRWSSSPLLMVRPGFILDEGLVDSIVGIGKPLPTRQVLGLGSKRTIIPVVSRETVHEAIAKLVDLPLANISQRNFMLVSPSAPTRRKYLDYHCFELGRGTHSVHVSPFIWKWGLAAASIPVSMLTRKQVRLAKLFEHNIRTRHYNCDQTARLLGVDLQFDWRARLRAIYRIKRNASGGSAARPPPPTRAGEVIYFGFGRIVKQKHLRALCRIGFTGKVLVRDPAVVELPRVKEYSLALAGNSFAGATHAVISAPWMARAAILRELPENVRCVLIEKPFAVSRENLSEMTRLTQSRACYVLHNYRLKENVRALRRFRHQHESGGLRHVMLRYETPSPFIERSAWIRQERRHRILVTDYSLHFLDLAWMFFTGAMTIQRWKITENARGELESVLAHLSFEEGDCTMLIRQGCHRREAHIHYAFQNYDAHLRFFPDVFTATFGGHSALDDLRLAVRAIRPTVQKLADKAGLTTADRSHDPILAGFLGLKTPVDISEFSVLHLLPFYNWLTEFADAAYN